MTASAPAAGAELPWGARFVGGPRSTAPGWGRGDAPADRDLSQCVACGLCLPQCPTYRLTGLEVASPRGRIAAMRQVAAGRPLDRVFEQAMDGCLGCRACETACPSQVPFGRMLERARAQAEPHRSAPARLTRTIALEGVLGHRAMLTAAATLASLTRPWLPRPLRELVPKGRLRRRALAPVTDPAVPPRGTVAVLRGCIQDLWYRDVNRATVTVLARTGWRVTVPAGQVCCGALQAHYGHLGAARRLARRNRRELSGVDHVVANAAGCGAHLRSYGELIGAVELADRVRDVSEFLHEHGGPVARRAIDRRIAVHDACHLLHAQGVHQAPRLLLAAIPGVELVPLAEPGRCCGAAGLHNLLQPRAAAALGAARAASIVASRAEVVAVANPGCAMQISAHLAAQGSPVRVAHPAQLLAAASRP